MNDIRIVFGSDHAGYKLKEKLIKHVMQEYRGSIDELLDTGCETQERVDYPDYAKKVALEIQDDSRRIGVLVCGTGIGMSMVANSPTIAMASWSLLWRSSPHMKYSLTHVCM